ncbi:MAG: hypothetical protein UIH27_13125 [Ruminococcus sp.]|nr:hypothetical protein [Ruminococcus sp.]
MDNKCRRIYNKLISLFAQTGEQLMFFRENDIANLSDLYSIYKKMEYALYDFGTLLFDLESSLPEGILESFDLEQLTASEKKELKRYLDRFRPEMIDCCFEKYGNGYRAVIPYLLNRRNAGDVFSPKRKYVVSVFERLLIQNRSIINKMPATTVFIVCCSPRRMSLRDNDNADGHDVINLIKRYLMTEDDSGLYLNVFYGAKQAENYYTEVYIMPHISIEKQLKEMVCKQR